MINLANITQIFEDGLNALLADEEISFKLWATVGEFETAKRNRNTVYEYINGSVKVGSSASDANILVMGNNSISLEFAIPLRRPKTNIYQTEQNLRLIQDGQIRFVQEILDVINKYFQETKTYTLTDPIDNKVYSLGLRAGTSLTGSVDLSSVVGNHVTVNVYVEVYFIEGGTISKDIVVTFDGAAIPFITLQNSRSGVLERVVYSGTLASKNYSTSSGFAIDVNFPSTNDKISKATLDYLLKGNINKAFFVNVKWGDVDEKLYLMTISNVNTSAQGILIAGITATLIEAVNNVEVMSYPSDYQIGYFTFGSSDVNELIFTLDEDVQGFILGEAKTFRAGANYRLTISPKDFIYNEETDNYRIYFITDKNADVSNSNAPFALNSLPSVYVVRGEYEWKEVLNFTSGHYPFYGSFTANGISYKGIRIGYDPLFKTYDMQYIDQNDKNTTVYNSSNGWADAAYRTINFGSNYQEVDLLFYLILKEHAIKVV